MGSVGSSIVLYRGVTSQQYIDDIFDKSTPTYMSDGVHGKGIYFTTNPKEAESYALSKPSSSSKFVAAVKLDMRKAKIISEPDVINQLKRQNISVTFEAVDEYMKVNGYNVLYSPSDGYYVVKDKAVLRRV